MPKFGSEKAVSGIPTGFIFISWLFTPNINNDMKIRHVSIYLAIPIAKGVEKCGLGRFLPRYLPKF